VIGFEYSARIGIRAGGQVLDRRRPEVMAAVSENTA
jgi:hypothetical protein